MGQTIPNRRCDNVSPPTLSAITCNRQKNSESANRLTSALRVSRALFDHAKIYPSACFRAWGFAAGCLKNCDWPVASAIVATEWRREPVEPAARRAPPSDANHGTGLRAHEQPTSREQTSILGGRHANQYPSSSFFHRAEGTTAEDIGL